MQSQLQPQLSCAALVAPQTQQCHTQTVFLQNQIAAGVEVATTIVIRPIGACHEAS